MATSSSINNKSVNKSMVMKAAWALVKKSEVGTFSEALKQAWKAIKLKVAMANGVVKFQYRKVSGEIRTAQVHHHQLRGKGYDPKAVL